MKKIRIAALLMALLMAFCTLPVSSVADSATAACVKKGVTLNVRSAPEIKKGNVIGKLKAGTVVKVQETVGTWSLVTWGASKDNVGYVASRYLTASTESTKSGCLYVKTAFKSGVNMRKGPSSDYDVIRVVRDGQAVEVLESSRKGWTKVRYKNQVGYIYTKYLSKTK